MSQFQGRSGTVRAQPWSSAQWRDYYEHNARNLLPLPWQRGPELSEAERSAFLPSLQDFQLGESSEGLHLLRRGAKYADRVGDHDYLEALRLFVKEEQRHAHVLGRFLTHAGAQLLEHSWLDGVFRRLRRLAGLELALTMLLIAETAGKVYYTVLMRSTGSLLLRRLCVQLLRDEIQHTRFHAERLALLRRRYGSLRAWWCRARHQVLFIGACLALWARHRRAFRAAGMSFRAFRRRCRQEMARVGRQTNPRMYDYSEVGSQTEVALV
jgi:hypothetical protein